MRRGIRTRSLGGVVVVGLGIIGASCSSGDGSTDSPSGVPRASAAAAPQSAPSDSAVVGVAARSQVSLALRGGLGPIVEGQTVTRAVVTLQDVQLVDSGGRSVSLVKDSFTADLVSLQDDLKQLAQEQTIEAGQFTQLRFRLDSAWIETSDAQSVTHVFATQGVDASQLPSGASAGRLGLSGVDPDGFVTAALPQSGIAVQSGTALAINFALAESLSLETDGTWTFSPRAWVVDAGTLSTVDVQFEASSSSSSFSDLVSQGFEVMLLDAGLRPICSGSLAQASSTSLSVSFRFIDSFQGPFVAVLVPPTGVSLTSAVAVSIEVHQSVRVEAHISVSSVQQVSRGTLDVRTSSDARVVARASSSGTIVSQTTQRVGAIGDVAPHGGSAEPLRPGEEPLPRGPVPALPGLPMPGQPRPSADGGAMPPPPPPRPDAGAMPPEVEGGLGPVPAPDAGVRPIPPEPDAGPPSPPESDASPSAPAPEPAPEAGGGAPFVRDGGAPRPTPTPRMPMNPTGGADRSGVTPPPGNQAPGTPPAGPGGPTPPPATNPIPAGSLPPAPAPPSGPARGPAADGGAPRAPRMGGTGGAPE